ncbi:MAG: 4-hydroxythreonine-4-phosphate dehydrogenase PdxA [Burkholderiales bacterium]|nr:4-hydroxythreonine-4-phosphate dehydrogenase PdxA [Burkholderiales bacterium]
MLPRILPRIAITCGEPAGIGPEISLLAAVHNQALADIVLLGDAAQLKELAVRLQLKQTVQVVPSLAQFASTEKNPQHIVVIDCSLAVPVVPGLTNPLNAPAVLQTLDLAIAAAMAGEIDGIVTAPLQKSVINESGLHFTGHTEYLAEKTNTTNVVMMLAAGSEASSLRVALATTHLALKDVSAAITKNNLFKTIEIIQHDLQSRFGITDPRICVTGLNPHAGEGGYLGHEEIEIITPAIVEAQQRGWKVTGPYPADTLFQAKYLQEADCVLAMYHDQGLPVLKYASFGQGVNITLGLPLIRTSVDHGTALDLAAQGLGLAEYGSMTTAIKVAVQMATNTASH